MAEGSAGTLYVDIRANLATLEKDLGRISSSLQKQAKSFQSIGEGLTKAITVPLGAAGALALKAAGTIGDAQRIIQTKTNATGDTLKGLNETFRQVATNSASSFGAAADATAVLFTATGQTGAGLTELATTVTQLSKLTGEDLNGTVTTAGQLFNAWGVETSKQSETLNVFYRAAKESGASVAEMLSIVSGSDEVFGSLGFSLNDSVALLATFKKNGIDAEGTVSALNKAIGFLSSRGVKDLEGGFQGLIKAIKDAPTQADAYKIALEAFGKSGIGVANAIREGRFEIDEFSKRLSEGGNTIKADEEKTRTFSEALQNLKNSFIDAFAPVGDVIIKQSESLKKVFQDVAKTTKNLVEAFGNLSPNTQENVVKMLALAFAMGPVSTWFGLVLQSGGSVVKVFKDLAGAVKDTEIAMAGLNIVTTPFSKLFTLIGDSVLALRVGFIDLTGIGIADVFAGLATTVGASAVGFGVFAGVIKLQGGDISLLLKGIGEILTNGFTKAWKFATDAGTQLWEAFSGGFRDTTETLLQDLDNFLVAIGVSGPGQFRAGCAAMTEIWNGFTTNFQNGLNKLSESWNGMWANFRKGLLVIGQSTGSESIVQLAVGMEAAAVATKKVAAEQQELAKNAKGAEVFLDGIGEAAGRAAGEMEKWGTKKKHVVDISNLLNDAKKAADEAAKAIAGLAKNLADEKAQAGIDHLKNSIDELVSGVGKIKGLGSSADLSGLFSDLSVKMADKLYSANAEALNKLKGKALEDAKATIDTIAAYQLQTYKEEVAKKQKEIDEKNHTETVSFFKGLMEDAISGTRFDWVEQMKKGAVEIAAEFAARLIEANIAGSKSFSELFSKVAGSFSDSLSSVFGDKLGPLKDMFKNYLSGGSSSGTSGIGPVIDGAQYASSLSGYGSTAAGLSDVGESMSVFSSGMAEANTALDGMGAASTGATAGIGALGVAAAGVGAAVAVGWGVSENYKTLGNWNSGTSNEKKTLDALTTIINLFTFGVLGTIINKALSPFFSGSAYTKNQQSIKGFEKFVEDTLSTNLKKAFNFDIGSINQFDDGTWATEFWDEFKDKGAGTFDALGKAFEKIMNLEPGSGGQIAALLAQNLVGDDLNQSLDNIKLFLDGMNISVADLQQALLDTANAGEITWQEFDVMNNKLAQVPVTGLAGLGDIKGAFDQVVTSGGRGIQAINGLKNIAIEAGEAGVKNFDELRQHLLAAGYDAQTVDAFFQALSQRGITSMEQFGAASDVQLQGVIADMTTIGDTFGGLFTDNKGLDDTTEGFGRLGDEIQNVRNQIENLPDRVRVTTELVDNTGAGGGGSSAAARSGQTFRTARTSRVSLDSRSRVSRSAGSGGGGSGADGPKIYIDARNADAGTETRLLNAMTSLRHQVLRDVQETISAQERRRVT